MFKGFETHLIPGDGAGIFCRIAGSGPPLLLLHGYPQTGAMWAPIAGALAQDFTVIVPDLRGYGASQAPDSAPDHEPYSKRAMARDMIAVMAARGFERFRLAGHDRGGRVAYRLVLDAPERVEQLALLDIIPTSEVWARMNAEAAMKTYHWPFLAQPYPMPETLIRANPEHYLDHTLASWTKAKSLQPFGADALEEYRRSFERAARIHAACEDYRAGATIDRALDEADRAAGRRIAAPTLAIWGSAGIAGADPLAIWRNWCETVEGREIDAGHMLVEEAPDETLGALQTFFRR